MKLLSIIIPIYNAEKYMSACIDSILDQTYRNFELILVNDGSKDDSGSICDNYHKKDDRVKVIHKENGGCSSARNMGLSYAKGELIAFVDADDVLDPDMYEILINNLNDTNSDVSACTLIKEYNPSTISTVIHKEIPVVEEFTGNDMYLSMTRGNHSIEGFVWNKVYKRDIVIDQQFRTDVAIVDDAVYSWEAFKKVHKVCYVYLPMYHYLIIPTSITRNSPLEKYMKALYGYELMLSDSKNMNDEITKNLAVEYLGWNVTTLSNLANQDKPSKEIYNKLKQKIEEYKFYFPLCKKKTKISCQIVFLGFYPTILFYRARNQLKKWRH